MRLRSMLLLLLRRGRRHSPSTIDAFWAILKIQRLDILHRDPNCLLDLDWMPKTLPRLWSIPSWNLLFSCQNFTGHVPDFVIGFCFFLGGIEDTAGKFCACHSKSIFPLPFGCSGFFLGGNNPSCPSPTPPTPLAVVVVATDLLNFEY